MAFQKSTVAVAVAVAVVCVILTVTTIGVLAAPKGSGKVKAVNVGVYADASCTVSCGVIDWGKIKAGGVVERVVYLRNSGSGVVTLKLSAEGWSSGLAGSVMDLSWDLGNKYRLQVGEVVAVTLSLHAAADTGGLSDFSFNVAITGVQR